jgi:hypothetical protein
MTVNERLHAVGLLDAFEKARSDGDKERMTSILRRVQVDEPSIANIIEA